MVHHKIAEDVKRITFQLGICDALILNSGSLLGAYRDGGLIPGDEDDIDFALPYSVAEHKMKEIIDAFVSEGYTLKRLRPTVMTFQCDEVAPNGRHIHFDFLFYKEDLVYYYETLYHNKRPFALLVPKRFWKNLSSIRFLGQTWMCPKDIDGFLEWRYGDWKTPVPRPTFGFQSLLSKPGLTKWL